MRFFSLYNSVKLRSWCRTNVTTSADPFAVYHRHTTTTAAASASFNPVFINPHAYRHCNSTAHITATNSNAQGNSAAISAAVASASAVAMLRVAVHRGAGRGTK